MSFQKKKKFYVLLSYFPSRPCSHLQAAFLDMRAASLVNLKHILVPEAAPYLAAPKIATSDWLRIRNKCSAHVQNRPWPEVTILGADQKKRGF